MLHKDKICCKLQERIKMSKISKIHKNTIHLCKFVDFHGFTYEKLNHIFNIIHMYTIKVTNITKMIYSEK